MNRAICCLFMFHCFITNFQYRSKYDSDNPKLTRNLANWHFINYDIDYLSLYDEPK